jgi:hypothetical protein
LAKEEAHWLKEKPLFLSADYADFRRLKRLFFGFSGVLFSIKNTPSKKTISKNPKNLRESA